ncbi:MAG: ATP-binding protein [Melioribacteraceae bacterium]
MEEKNYNNSDQIQCDSIIENFAFGIFRISGDGTLTFANNSFIRLLGFDSFAGLSSQAITSIELKECFSVNKYSSYLSKNNLAEPFENRWIKKNGLSLLFRERVTVNKNDDGDILFYDCIVEDITGHVIIEKLIRDLHVGDYSILKALPDFIFVLSNTGVFIDYKNSNYHNLFFNPHQLKGHSVIGVFPKEIGEQILEIIGTVFQTGDLQTFEFQLETENPDELLFFEARFVMSDYEKVLMILRDISIQKLAEIQIQKFTEELKHLNETKDKFFSIISHDLRTPINGLLGYAEILSNEIDGLEKEEIKEFAGNIAEISKSTNTLLNNILDWSRVQTGRISFQPEIIDLSYSVKRIMNLLNASASNKNISLINSAAAGTHIYADENMLHSILINLTGNAIKFTHNDGTIRIACEELDNYFHLSVSDNGIGISKTNIEKLLDSNIIYSTNGTAKEKGTGLGLLLCKEFVEKHSGKIWIESEEGNGTIFHFTLAKKNQQL